MKRPPFGMSVFFLVALFTLPVFAKGYLVAERGQCVTVIFHYDAGGKFIGTSSQNSPCPMMPDGVWVFDLVVKAGTTQPTINSYQSSVARTASDPSTKNILASVAVSRDMTLNPARYHQVTLPHEYGKALELGLNCAPKVTVYIPPDYLRQAGNRDTSW